MFHVVLYQPEIPSNAGNLIRLCANTGSQLHLIEPLGFSLEDRQLRRAGLDYLDAVDLTRHVSWSSYMAAREANRDGRLVLLTTRAATAYTRFAYQPGDTLLLGRESAGVPDAVRQVVDAAVLIPMVAGMRSLNVAVAGAMVLGEALRQIDGFPEISP